MKKSLLLLSALTLCCSAFAAPVSGQWVKSENAPRQKAIRMAPTRAESSNYVIYDNAEYVMGAYTFNGIKVKDVVYLAFELTPEQQAPYIGNEITQINIVAGTSASYTNVVRNVYAYATDDISNGIKELTPATLKAAEYGDNLVTLKNPVAITGEKPLYIGYMFELPSTNSYFLTVDGVTNDENRCLMAIQSDFMSAPEFYNYADQVGSLCISCIIEGDNLPQNLVSLKSVDIPSYTAYNDGKISYPVTIKNLGVNDITSLTVATEISNGSKSENEVSLSEAVGFNEEKTVTVSDVTDISEGIEILSAKITKVNGVEVSDQSVRSGVLNAYSEGYKRYPVIEKATGVGCGYCPRGIVSFECISKNYPDWILIAIHDNWFGPDPMTIPQYNDMLLNYFTSNPEAITNRRVYTDLYGDYPQAYEDIYNEFTSNPAYGDIEFTGTIDQDSRTIKIDAEVEFSTSSSMQHLLSFVVVEDGLGPYNQHNYFTGNSMGAMSGWEKLGEYVPTIYDDVARMLVGFPGIKNSLPATIEPNKTYEFSTNVSLANVSKDDFRVIGLITNSVTGEIINAKQYSFKWNGINGVAGDESVVSISIDGNNIVVTGARNYAVYSLSGAKVGTMNLPQGVYVVKADGLTKKVLVK